MEVDFRQNTASPSESFLGEVEVIISMTSLQGPQIAFPGIEVIAIARFSLTIDFGFSTSTDPNPTNSKPRPHFYYLSSR